MKYPKIQTLFKRNDKFKVDTSLLRMPEFGLVKRWLVTEKVDGTNVRIIRTAEGERVIHGRTDRADWARRESPLKKVLEVTFPLELLNQVFDPGIEVILYGEGYGAGIQKGGCYRENPSFRLFDVKVGEWWLNWVDVEDVAEKIEIKTVPVVWIGREELPTCYAELEDIIPCSVVANYENDDTTVQAEGIVARTEPLLFTRYDERVMWKLKFKDFA